MTPADRVAWGQVAATLTDAARTITASLDAFGRSLDPLVALFRRFGFAALIYQGDPLHRPDGRARRSGHRHRGTRAWARRWG